jgi:hypothetical protein
MTTDPLKRVRQAKLRAEVERIAAENRYRAAVLEALAAGHSYAEIAEAVGVTRQAIRQLHLRAEG